MKLTIKGDYIVFEVESQSRAKTHEVLYNRATQEWSCTCEDYWYRKRVCKHCREAIQMLQDLHLEALNGSANAYNGETVVGAHI